MAAKENELRAHGATGWNFVKHDLGKITFGVKRHKKAIENEARVLAALCYQHGKLWHRDWLLNARRLTTFRFLCRQPSTFPSPLPEKSTRIFHPRWSSGRNRRPSEVSTPLLLSKKSRENIKANKRPRSRDWTQEQDPTPT